MAGEQTEVLVLMDREGNNYLIPRSVLEQTRANDEQRAVIQDAVRGDTSGFWGGTFEEPGTPGRQPEREKPPPRLVSPVGFVTLPTASLGALSFPSGLPM